LTSTPRSDPVGGAVNGNTGNSSAPHVHFEVVASSDPGPQELRVRYVAQMGPQQT
jgi:murein DD-endopeptidase MepM/ murein hydrolase activator NlpD